MFPLHGIRDGLCTCGFTDCANQGKHPHTSHGLHDATVNEAAIRRWWTQWPDANIGLRAEDIGVVVDIDPRNGGDESYDRICTMFGHVPDTVEVLTGGGGSHFYFTSSRPITSGKLPSFPGVDIKSLNGYVVAPPSLHLSGQRYEFEASSDLLEGQAIAACPDWVYQMRGEAASSPRKAAPGSVLPPLSPAFPPDLEEARHALRFINSDCPYEDWVKVGQAIHSQLWLEGFDLWHAWSSEGAKYTKTSRKAMERKWASFHAVGGVNIGTLFFMAKAAGWNKRAASPAAIAPLPAGEYRLKPASGSFLVLRAIRWVIEGWIAAGEVVTFAGQPGVGKSTAFAGISMVVAGFGRAIGSNLANDRPRRVIIVSEHPEQYQRLIYGFIARYALDGREVEKRIAVYDTTRLRLVEIEREFDHLIEVHSEGESDPPLIIMDTASASFDLENENDNAQVGGMLAAIKRPVARTGAPLWIIAHAAKALGREDADITPRGASAYMGDVHGTASVFREKDRPESIFIRSLKNRNQREFDEIELVTTVDWYEVVDERGVIQRQGIRIAAPMVAAQTQGERFAEAKAANQATKLQAAKAYVVDYIEARPGEVITARTFYPPEERGRHSRDMVRDGIAELLQEGVLGRETIDPPPKSGPREKLVLLNPEWGKGLWR